MLKVTVDDAFSFARSFGEQTGSVDQSAEVTAGWITRENPVLAQLVFQMATKLSAENSDPGHTSLAVAADALRLLEHAECNRHLAHSLCGEGCDQQHRRLCCQKTGAATTSD
jgi:hypothetical protein